MSLIGETSAALNIADAGRNRVMDLLVIAAVAGVIYIWWQAQTSHAARPLAPNQDTHDVPAPGTPDSVYTYNMPFYNGNRTMTAQAKAPSPTRIPMNPSGQPTYAPADVPDEHPFAGAISEV